MATAPDRRGLFDDLYHHLVSAPWPRLLVTLAGLYLAANAVFALAYLAAPGSIENARLGSFVDAFFFSVQTMATIGYGKLVPRTVLANVPVTVEAFAGLFGLAMVTGLMFARFSRPTARVLFSRRAVVAPHDGVPCLMFRMANARGNNIVHAQVQVVLARQETTLEGDQMRRFHDLVLLRPRSTLFAFSWTAMVHARHHYQSDDLAWGRASSTSSAGSRAVRGASTTRASTTSSRSGPNRGAAAAVIVWAPWRAGQQRSSSSCWSPGPRGRAATSPCAGRSGRRASWWRPRAAPAWWPRAPRSSSPRSTA